MITIDIPANFGDSVRDRKTGACGKVTAVSASDDGRRGVWVSGLDSTGRPFDAYIAADDIELQNQGQQP